jgi:hypothetical protein
VEPRRGNRGAWFLGSLVLLWFLLPLPLTAEADPLSLIWDPNPEPDLAGYEVYIGTSPGTYTQTTDVGNVTTFLVSGLSPGETYYFAVRAYDIFANKSSFSNEVSTTIPETVAPSAPELEAQPESEPGSAITLSAIGYKIKGWQKVQVSWNGSMAANVDIYRNGSKITATANDGSYADHINKRGKGTYVYQVCVEGTSTCSNEATVTKFN